MKKSANFTVGDRVKLNAYAKRCGLRLQARANDTGTVVGLRPPFSIRVLPDGYAQAQRWSASFWTAIPGPAGKE
jgi:hypothetical protein